MSQKDSLVWLITGCSTGFGRELAKQVLERGDNAVVTARKPDEVADLVKGHEDAALALKLDVTKPDEVKSVVEAAEKKFGRVDALVNNAGYGYLSAIEEGEDEAVRTLIETNFFGLVEMTKAVLPGMRKQKSGRIVNISSIGGLVSFAATGYYHAAKYAVEGLSESLSLEVAPLGIKVMIVEPGPFRTDWLGRSIKESKTRIADYDETAGKRREQGKANNGRQVGDPVRGAKAIIKAITSENPPLRLVLGKPGLELVEKKLKSVLEELDAWRETTLSADFPEEEQQKKAS